MGHNILNERAHVSSLGCGWRPAALRPAKQGNTANVKYLHLRTEPHAGAVNWEEILTERSQELPGVEPRSGRGPLRLAP